MHTVLDDLIELLKLERIEDNIFRGDSRDIGSAQVFGGQVLADQRTHGVADKKDGRPRHCHRKWLLHHAQFLHEQ